MCVNCGEVWGEHVGYTCPGRKGFFNPEFDMPVPTGGVPKVKTTNNTPEPAPVANAKPAVWPLVMVDMAERDKFGREKYGTPLQPHNGRDALKDAYQEALDLAVYLRAAIFERDGK
jgi:hypothetical protein